MPPGGTHVKFFKTYVLINRLFYEKSAVPAIGQCIGNKGDTRVIRIGSGI